MPVDDWIGEQVVQGDTAALLKDLRVLLHQQPAHMSEKEAALGVVRVGVRLAVLVVNTVVTGPFIDRVLIRQKSQSPTEPMK